MPDGDGAVSPPTAEQVMEALEVVTDPEIGFSIVDLGLVYDIDVTQDGAVTVTMTLTSMGCPAGPQILGEAAEVVKRLDGVTDVKINLVWTPRWTPDMIKEEVRWLMGR
ncbi:MAG TPA: metal-sulfur cluster assembly factor [Limnochordia bacterium]